MVKNKIYTIPNALSFYRLLIFPYLLFLVFSGAENLFSIFIGISLITDVLDGFIARTFNQVSKLGARLDSLADYGTFISAFLGLLQFRSADLQIHGWILYLFMGLLVVTQVYHILKFKSFSSMHLYSFKITGYLHGILFLLWFFVEFYPVYYYVAMSFGILAEVEVIVVTALLQEKQSNARGLYWVIKKRRVGKK